MTFLDASFIVRHLVTPTTVEQRTMAETAHALFAAVRRGDELVTTTEVVLHEVAYVLASKHHYNQPPAAIVASLRALLLLPGFTLPRGLKRRYLRALDIYASYPALGFADAIVAAAAEQLGFPLATFDAHFNRLSGLTRWQPPSASGTP